MYHLIYYLSYNKNNGAYCIFPEYSKSRYLEYGTMCYMCVICLMYHIPCSSTYIS